MAIIQKMSNDKCCLGYGETGTLNTPLVGMQNSAVTLENTLAIPQNVKHKSYPYGPALPFLDIYLSGKEAYVQRKTCT